MTRPISDYLPGPFPTPEQRAGGAALLASLLAKPRRFTGFTPEDTLEVTAVDPAAGFTYVPYRIPPGWSPPRFVNPNDARPSMNELFNEEARFQREIDVRGQLAAQEWALAVQKAQAQQREAVERERRGRAAMDMMRAQSLRPPKARR